MKPADIAEVSGSTVLLDLDGTVVAAGRDDVDDETRAAVETLRARNAVYIVSNKRLPERKRRLAAALGIKVLETRFRKPDPRLRAAVAGLPKPYVVIGDRFLTDGLFARVIGARFVRAARLTRPDDPWLDRLLYFTDDLLTGRLFRR